MTSSRAAQKRIGAPFEGGRDAFEALFESVSEAVLIFRRHRLHHSGQPTVEKLFGYTRDELRGQPIEMLVPERFRQAHLGYRQHYYQDPARDECRTGTLGRAETAQNSLSTSCSARLSKDRENWF